MILRYGAAIAGGIALALHVASLGDWMLDDAFVFFRYAQNWVQGLGPVFNAGERVEGYTSFLWLILLAAATRFGCDPVLASQILGTACAAATLRLLASAHRAWPQSTASTSQRAVLFLGTCGAFTAWPASGMEVGLAALLTTFATLHTVRLWNHPTGHGLVGLGILAALLAATRPEALLLVAILLFAVQRRFPRRGWVAVVVFATLFAPYFAWRWTYYGWPLPNTFYAKVGGTAEEWRRGVAYTLRFLRLAAPLVAAIAIALGRRRAEFAPRGLLLAVVAAQLGFAIAVGGDLMPAFRFIAPVVPLLALLAADAVGSLASGRTLAITTAGIAAWGLAGMRFDPDVHGRIQADRVVRAGTIAGSWMRANLPADAVLATNTAGSVPYYSGLRCVDMLGLTDAHIAHRRTPDQGRGWVGHEKFDGAYVLSRRPNYVQLGSALGSEQPVFPSDHDLWRQPGFQTAYELRTYELELAHGTVAVHLYRRRDTSGP